MGIHTHDAAVAWMRADCSICRSEGFSARTRVQIELDGKRIVAAL
jgi:thymidine phosphorylase